MEMGRILIGVLLTVASFILVESLTCNKCSFRLVDVCLDEEVVTCSTDTSVCFTGEATFPSLQAFSGFTTQGCREPPGCNTTANSALLDLTVQVKVACCSSDECNPSQVSGAPSAAVTLAVTLGAAGLASLGGKAP